jgi:hypothetical protein
MLKPKRVTINDLATVIPVGHEYIRMLVNKVDPSISNYSTPIKLDCVEWVCQATAKDFNKVLAVIANK